MFKVTTSWDDGDILDKRLANLLQRYGVKGTFYITKNYNREGRERLSETDIQHISIFHEIGAHTLTHPDLRTLSKEKLREEIGGSKKWLEEIVGKEINMFCYPKGLYNDVSIRITKEARFIGARTTKMGSINKNNNPFELPTTIQIYPFPFRKINKNTYYWSKLFQPFIERSGVLRKIGVPIFSMQSWLSISKKTFDIALEKGEVFHLWGHSWEIEKYGMWDELEKLLQYISKKQSCEYVTNSELLN